jgi:hypothetical protein
MKSAGCCWSHSSVAVQQEVNCHAQTFMLTQIKPILEGRWKTSIFNLVDYFSQNTTALNTCYNKSVTMPSQVTYQMTIAKKLRTH